MSSFKRFEDTKSNFVNYEVKDFLNGCLANDPMYVYEYIQSLMNFIVENQDQDRYPEPNDSLETILRYNHDITNGLNAIINIDKHTFYFIICRVPIILSMNSSFDKNELFKNNITYKSYSEIIDQFTPELVEKFKDMIPIFDDLYNIIKDGSFMKLYEKEMTLEEFYNYLCTKLHK